MRHCVIKKGLYIYLPSESNGPNLLDEPLKGFIVNPIDLPWKWVKRLATSGERVNHDYSESVQPLQSVKLIYQPCSRSRAALDPYGIDDEC